MGFRIGDSVKVKEGILKDAPPNTIFAYLSDSEPELQKVPREEW